MLTAFELERPRTLKDALTMVAQGGTPYCGGTELLAVMKVGLMAPEVLVDLKRVAELAGIDADDSEIVIRARATHREVAGFPVVDDGAAILAEATRLLGNARVRATGTLAGNICFAEPRSDVATALLALDAQVDLIGTDRERRSVSMGDFVAGAFVTARREDELVESIRVPRRDHRGTYVRFQPNEYPTVSVALVDGDDGGTRVVVGAVGERPEAFAADDLASVDPREIAASVDVTEDLNGSEAYKRHLVAVMIGRAVERLGTREQHA